MRDRWGFWDWTAYTGIFVAATMLAYEAALHSSPLIAASLPSLAGGALGFLPFALLSASGIVFLLQRFGVLPHGKGKPETVGFPKWPDPYTPISVAGKTFLNEKVVLDGHSYSNCTFVNVTFAYNGTTPIQLANIKINGPIRFHTDNSAVEGTIILLYAFGMTTKEFEVGGLAPGQIQRANRTDA